MKKSGGTVRFIKNGLLLTGASFFMRLIGVKFNAFVSAKVGADGIGLYTLIMSVYGFAVTLASSGVSLAATRMCAEADSESEKRSALRRCALYAAVCGTLSCSLLLILGKFIGESLLGDARCVIPLRLLALSMPFIALSNVIHGYFSAERKVSRSAAVSVFEQLFRITVTVWLLGVVPEGIEYACIALLGGGMLSEIASFLAVFSLYLLDRRHLKYERTGIDGQKLSRKLFSITLPVAAAAYIRSGLTTLEHILIPRGLRQNPATSEHALASYGILCGMVMPVIMLPTAFLYSFTGLLIPEFAEASSHDEKRRVVDMSVRAASLTLSFSFGCAALLSVFANELGMLIYKNKECGDFIKIMAPLIPVMYLDHAVDSILKGLGEQLYCMKVNILDAAMCALMVFILCPRIGIYGYVVTIYISEAVNASLSLARLCKKTGSGVSPRAVVRPVLGALSAALIVRFMPPDAGIVSLALRGCVFCGVYLLTQLIGARSNSASQTHSRHDRTVCFRKRRRSG